MCITFVLLGRYLQSWAVSVYRSSRCSVKSVVLPRRSFHSRILRNCCKENTKIVTGHEIIAPLIFASFIQQFDVRNVALCAAERLFNYTSLHRLVSLFLDWLKSAEEQYLAISPSLRGRLSHFFVFVYTLGTIN